MVPSYDHRDPTRTHTGSRSRSRSPHRQSSSNHIHRSRSNDHERQHRRHHHHAHHSSHKRKRLSPDALPPKPIVLPLRAAPLSKHDLDRYRFVFASYLDIQKQLEIGELSEEEVRGRWKSFLGKWNRGELAEGWYDPSTKQKADDAAAEYAAEEAAEEEAQLAPRQSRSNHSNTNPASHDPTSDSESSSYGPDLPSQNYPHRSSRPRPGPIAPNTQDLALRDELTAEDTAATRTSLHHARATDRRHQKDLLDELAPKAEAGTRERQLEKKRENAAAARGFRDAKGGAGEIEEVGEGELFGGGGGVEEVKRMKKEGERKRNEREVRREEVLRARAVEREERMAVHREREEKTMGMLRAIARERFG